MGPSSNFRKPQSQRSCHSRDRHRSCGISSYVLLYVAVVGIACVRREQGIIKPFRNAPGCFSSSSAYDWEFKVVIYTAAVEMVSGTSGVVLLFAAGVIRGLSSSFFAPPTAIKELLMILRPPPLFFGKCRLPSSLHE